MHNPTTPSWTISGNLVDPVGRRTFPARLEVVDGRIASVTRLSTEQSTFLLPGLIDSHVHIESSMLVPSEFARAAVVHGTVASVSDPHEIGNVLGVEGVRYMLEGARGVPFHFFFGAPSCVPATGSETAGATIGVDEVARLLDDPRIVTLSEMMNFPGVLRGNADVLAKIRAARDRGKPVDGHAPGLRGSEAKAYFDAGISTDHECTTYEEAKEKIAYGALVAIREGSAARNFDDLCPLIEEHPDRCLLCSDDKHPDELVMGHIDELVRRAVARGIDPMHLLRAACVNPVLHYGLDVGLLRPRDWADLIEVDNLEDFRVLRTYVRGRKVAERGDTTIERVEPPVVNRFHATVRRVEELSVRAETRKLNVIEAYDGQLITGCRVVEPSIVDGNAVSDPGQDVLKMTVVNRYRPAPVAVAFIHGFGLDRGAIASSVAHDSHNIVAVGVNDEDLVTAVNLVIEARGGLAVAAGDERHVLPLPIAGLMSTASCDDLARHYAQIDQQAKRLGTRLRAPFMTLSFMALLVIPRLKLSDLGLFDGTRFQFEPLFA